MNIDLDNRYIKELQKLLFFIAFIYLVAQMSKLFLPSYGIFLSQNSIGQMEYKKYSIFDTKDIKTPQQQVKEVVVTQSISRFRLKALVYEGKYSGYIIIEDSGNTEVLSIGDMYKGYKLDSLTSSSAIFIKDGILSSVSLSQKLESLTIDIPDISQNSYKSIYRNNSYEVKKSDIHSYAKNPRMIWKNIKIYPVKKNSKIVGYKVKSVKKDSVFEQLGIKKNDLITKVNNVILKSNKDAIKLYKSIDQLDNILITLDRNGSEIELEYELH